MFPQCGKPIHEAVGIGIVALSGTSHHGSHGRKEHEKIERVVSCRLVEKQGSENLGGQHGIQIFRGLVDQQGIPYDPGGVNHAVDLIEIRFHLPDNALDMVPDGYVRLEINDLSTGLLQGIDSIRLFCAQIGTPHQHQGNGRVVFDQMIGENKPETACPACDKIAPVFF